MKKSLYLFAIIFGFCSIFAACSDDDDLKDEAAPTGNPAQVAAGTYTGSWTRIAEGDTTVVDGTVTITATDSAYTADFQFVSEAIALNQACVANIAFAGHDGQTFVFNNDMATNTLGSVFAGRIEQGTLNTSFQIRQKAGRKMKLFSFYFMGKK